ncbi:hypothetical protein FRC07_011985, partial [Ceratobasidium sp. 392]
MEDAIFCDPDFTNNYLVVDEARLTTVLNNCKADLDDFRYPTITRERQLYQPILSVLNRIKQAVDSSAEHGPSSPDFEDVHDYPMSSHGEDTAGLKPDLALFDGTIQHWEIVKMPIEVKTKPTHLKVGMKQLARYARAVFANQLHRRHVYGMVICKWAATFVRFDRGGIIFSEPVDMRSQAFREAFAKLMMLDEEAFGYDTAFTTRPTSEGKLEYYIDLPAAAFPPESEPNAASDAQTTTHELNDGIGTPSKSTKRLKVMHTLCHRKSIRGRATTALRVREVIRSGVLEKPKESQESRKTRSQTKLEEQQTQVEVEELGTRDYVLKLMWRDSKKKMEGEVMKRLVGIYGVGQYMWHSDAFKKCNTPDCGRSMENSCGKCLDKIPSRDGLLVVENLNNLDVVIPEEPEDDEETQYVEVETDKCSPAYAQVAPSIYCRLLMSTVGSPLCTAESPRELLEAILDAVLGYWRLVNMGLLHRDISDGNILRLPEGNGYSQREWELPRATTNKEDSVLARSEALLQGILSDLGRDPTGMLNDFDLSKTHNMLGISFFDDLPSEEDDIELGEDKSKRRKLNPNDNSPDQNKGKGGREAIAYEESSLGRTTKTDKSALRIDFRTGTPAFMSARILDVEVGQQYEHYFMDDLESFFWLILWCVAEHTDVRGAKATDAAYELLNGFSKHDLKDIAKEKLSLLMYCGGKGARMQKKLADFDNTWSKDSAIVSVVLKLGA